MKRSEIAFNLGTIAVDILSLVLAAMVAFFLRDKFQGIIGQTIYNLTSADFLLLVVKIIPVIIAAFAVFGLYNLRGTRKFISEFNRIVASITLGLLIVIVLFFFDQTIFPSRFIILAAWALSVVFVVSGRLILKTAQGYLFAKGYGLHNLVVIKGIGTAQDVVHNFLRKQNHGYKIVKELSLSPALYEDLNKLYESGHFDELIVTDSKLDQDLSLQIVEFARSKGIQYSFIPDLFEVQRNVVELSNIKGVPLISLKNTPLDGWGRILKRVFDVAASLACLIITLPIFLAIIAAIKLDSPGKVIYSALRGGRGKDFWFYKFRSMYSHLSVGEGYGGDEAEKVRQELWQNNDRGGADGPFLKIKHDPRVTKVGRFLRKSKLDELPQFWNVLKGDMSMVGPRAHVIDEVERYRSKYRRMFSIKPGIFGVSQMAQMNWPDLPFEEEIKLNTYYIENWSMWWDIKILAKTFYMLFFAPKPKDDY